MKPNSTARQVLACAAAVAVVTACGTATNDPGADPDPDPTGGTGTGIDPDAEVVGSGMILQEGDGAPELCLGPVSASYPPQCGGPELIGFDWDELPEKESASGVTWGSAVVVGTYDADADTFTLTWPVAESMELDLSAFDQEPHAGFDALCDDPWAEVPEEWDPESQAAMDEQNELLTFLETYDGYVSSWVSDGHIEFNVLVTGDADQAHAEIRELWSGPLCVEQRDVPTAEELNAAQQALHDEVSGVLSSGHGAEPVLGIELMLADDDTVAAAHEAVEQWLTPEDVQISSALVPLADVTDH